MGMNTQGIVAYGYNVGDSAPVTGLGEDEDWRPADFTGDHYEFDFRDWAERKLMAAAGHPVEEDGYFDPEDTKKHGGVWFEAEGYGENPGYLLVAFETHSYDSPNDIDFTELERRRVEEGWDDKLAAVLEILGIPGFTYPEDIYKDVKREQSPRWMLTSYYG
jgi:hypothetical protein